MDKQFPLHLHEIKIVPLDGFYFRLPECEFNRDDINVYVEWFDVYDEGKYAVRVYATIHQKDNSRFQVDSFTVSGDDINQGYDSIIGIINNSDNFKKSVGRLIEFLS